ncbi:hypothetical protein [Marisediminicola senii]|uniref:hypothetical protein n=1 Tax=Marisediminicola senii TaxID=2711233 RepID=UPI0013EC76FA|nr:hypothetical protein [Marisediminicola senii]
MSDNTGGTPNDPVTPPPPAAPAYDANASSPAYNQTAAPSAYGQGGPNQVGGPGEDPGKTLGIVGLVLAFVFNIAGLIVSIIANKKSKDAGYKNGFAKAGIIISIISIVLGIAAAGFFIYAATQVGADPCLGYPAGEYVTEEGDPITCP